MAFFWVQQWVAFPVVLPDSMGDLAPQPSPKPQDVTAAGLVHDDHQNQASLSSGIMHPNNNTPFYSQFSSIPSSQPRPDLRSPAHPTSPHHPLQDQSAGSLNMGAMTGALPEIVSGDAGQAQLAQRQLSGASTSALVYQLHQDLQMQVPSSAPIPTQPGYGANFGMSQYQQGYLPHQASTRMNYPPYATGQQRPPGPSLMQPAYQHYSQQSPYMYYPTAYATQHYAPGFQGPNAAGQAMYGRRPSLTPSHIPMSGHGVDVSQQEGMFSPGHRQVPGLGPGDPGSMAWAAGGQFPQPLGKNGAD